MKLVGNHYSGMEKFWTKGASVWAMHLKLLVAYGPGRIFLQLMTFGTLTGALGGEDRLFPSN
jgi:hypothetical protein